MDDDQCAWVSKQRVVLSQCIRQGYQGWWDILRLCAQYMFMHQSFDTV